MVAMELLVMMVMIVMLIVSWVVDTGSTIGIVVVMVFLHCRKQ